MLASKSFPRAVLPSAITGATLALLTSVLASGCLSGGAPPGPATTDAGEDADRSSPAECANFGCAAPPPCGQACTDPCGCCPNLTCEDAGASDASPADATASDASGHDASGGACSVPLIAWGDAGGQCQPWVADNCCAEQAACANDKGCKAVADCVNMCERGGSNCLVPCDEDTSGLLAAFTNCTQADHGAAGHLPAICDYP